MEMSRRGILALVLALAGAPAIGGLRTAFADTLADRLYAPPEPFPDDFVVEQARALAARPFVEEKVALPPELAELTYDQYRDIRFDLNKSLWRDRNVGFQLDLFHTGFYYKTPVDVFIVNGDQQRRLQYVPDLFTFGPSVKKPAGGTDLHYAGIRIRYPVNRPDYVDEVTVFQGASYFRAVAKGQLYGLSARGLAIDTAEPKGEEFPAFRSFWVREPQEGANTIVVYALLNSPSTTGAYRFTIRPGDTTLMDVEMTLFPRNELAHVGIAPLTSMFLFDGTNRAKFEDYRRAVHDSDGLAMLTGRGEWLWRPLANPARLQVSAFVDRGPRGFGLMQRQARYEDFLDLEATYERRPSLWVEPVGDWGEGYVTLVEIPSDREIHDNIVAYWRPARPLPAGTELSLTYRLHWGGSTPPQAAPNLAKVAKTLAGRNFELTRKLFVIDFVGGDTAATAEALVEVSAGKVSNVVVHPNSQTGGRRLSFELDPEGAELIELRALLRTGDQPLSETWLYRWTP